MNKLAEQLASQLTKCCISGGECKAICCSVTVDKTVVLLNTEISICFIKNALKSVHLKEVSCKKKCCESSIPSLTQIQLGVSQNMVLTFFFKMLHWPTSSFVLKEQNTLKRKFPAGMNHYCSLVILYQTVQHDTEMCLKMTFLWHESMQSHYKRFEQ